MAEIAPVVELQNQQVPPVALTPEEEVVKLKAENETLKVVAEKSVKLQSDLDGAVSELIELRKKKSVSPEEKEKLEKLLKEKDAEIALIKKQRNDEVLNSLAAQSQTPPTLKTTEINPLTSEEEELRKSKGWTVEKFVSMKAKYGNVIFPFAKGR